MQVNKFFRLKVDHAQNVTFYSTGKICIIFTLHSRSSTFKLTVMRSRAISNTLLVKNLKSAGDNDSGQLLQDPEIKCNQSRYR